MNNNFEACPYCGKKIMKGAMRCMACGKILKTADEQQLSIERYKKSQESSFINTIVKFIFFLLFIAALGILYRFYGDQILDFIRPYLN
ncbi:MAG: hypothetical protein OEV42_01905 [Deltaproteobacteria bacterium]|nr:hypothetical protein [Deltaproteobacteria bacterium]